jgi:hypothetical protein
MMVWAGNQPVLESILQREAVVNRDELFETRAWHKSGVLGIPRAALHRV